MNAGATGDRHRSRSSPEAEAAKGRGRAFPGTSFRDEQRATRRECGEHACGRRVDRARREGVKGVGGPDDVERSDGVVELLHKGFVASGPDERRAKHPRGLQQRERRRVEQVVLDPQLTGQGADTPEVLQRLRELS